jgi:DNA-binding IclR family transcriptional regulator
MQHNGKVKYSAPAAAATAELLLALARNERPLSINELTERTGYTKSLLYRVLAELEMRDFVTRLPDGNYWLGLASVELGGAFSASVTLMSSVRSVLRRLADATQETVNLGVLEGDQVLYLMREEGARSVFAVSHVGKRLPANSVALGKALLAEHADAEVRAAFAARLSEHAKLPALTAHTITSLDDLLDELARVRERGHAEENEEAVVGRCCAAVAAPFGQPRMETVAISVSMDEAHFHETHDEVLAGLLEARDQIVREARARSALGEVPSSTAAVMGGLS